LYKIKRKIKINSAANTNTKFSLGMQQHTLLILIKANLDQPFKANKIEILKKKLKDTTRESNIL
jgi:hypothetical protein